MSEHSTPHAEGLCTADEDNNRAPGHFAGPVQDGAMAHMSGPQAPNQPPYFNGGGMPMPYPSNSQGYLPYPPPSPSQAPPPLPPRGSPDDQRWSSASASFPQGMPMPGPLLYPPSMPPYPPPAEHAAHQHPPYPPRPQSPAMYPPQQQQQQPLYPPRTPNAPYPDQATYPRPQPAYPEKTELYPPSDHRPSSPAGHFSSTHTSPHLSHPDAMPVYPPRDTQSHMTAPYPPRPHSPSMYPPPAPSPSVSSDMRMPDLPRPSSSTGYPPPHPPPHISAGNSPHLQPPAAPSSSSIPMPMPMPMPMPGGGTNRYYAFQPQISYPPPGYARPPAQDFISRFRSSTVQPSSVVEAEHAARKELREKLLRKDSTKQHATTDSSDEEEEEAHADDERRKSKPLPPAPYDVQAPEAAATTADDDGLETLDSTDPALLSVISRMFAKSIKEVVRLRELSFTDEYPDAFTGQEALDTMLHLLRSQYPGNEHLREYCAGLLTALHNSEPNKLLKTVGTFGKTKRYVVQGSADETFQLQSTRVVGVYTPMTQCYVRGCTPGQGCYAPRCPNKTSVQELETEESLARSVSQRTVAYSEGMQVAETWGQRMDPEFYQTVDKRERDRQEAINEIIYGEEQYLKDLELLREAIIDPMKESGVVAETEWEFFARDVFNNHTELEQLSVELFTDLYERFQEHEDGCIPGIADILLKHFDKFRDPYALYVPNVNLAEYIVADMKKSRPGFNEFLQSVLSDTRLNRQPFRHFLLRPVLRLPRYPLLLQALMKKTDKDDPEYEILVQCNEKISEVCKLCDQLTATVKTRVEILLLNNALTCRQGEFYDLKLTDPQRKIYYRGDLKLENLGLDIGEKFIHVIVFDHIVLLTKARKTSDNTEYKIWRRPVPLQMLHVQGIENDFTLPSQLSMTSSSTYVNLRPSLTMRSENLSLVLTHPGRHGETYYLQCANQQEKDQWLFALKQARTDLKKLVDAFNVISLESTFFKDYAAASTSDGCGKVNSTVPFVTTNNIEMLAIGTSVGVFFKPSKGGRARPILSLRNVTQLGVMQKYQILLVLADKMLYAYPLDELTSPKNSKAPDRLAHEISDPVHFFQTGVCNGIELLVYARQKTVSTIFTAVKPVRSADSESKSRGISFGTRNLFRHHNTYRSPWFEDYKEFSVGAQAVNIHFLKSKFAVVCDKAFEIIDPDDLSTSRSIPNDQDPQFDFLEQRSDGLRPLAMYRIQNKFLLCYNKFAFYVNNRDQSLIPRDETSALLCEWENHPDNIVYHHPYVLAFDQRFIEVRHVETGDLVQMIPGNDCRLTYYNGNGYTLEEPLVIQGCIVHAKNQNYQDVFHLEPNNEVEQEQESTPLQ